MWQLSRSAAQAVVVSQNALSLGHRAAAAATEAPLCHLHTVAAAGQQASSRRQHSQQASAAGSSQQHNNNNSGQQRRWWTAAAAAALGLAAAAAAGSTVALADSSKAPHNGLPSNQQPQPSEADGVSAGGKLLSLPMRQRIFFKYEKRIRDLSSLEKIYEYFATSERDGRKVMRAQDVVRALVPTYPPVGSSVERAGFLDGERGHSQTVQSAHESIMYFFDHNNDGVIGFDEFVLIVLSLAVPEKDVDVVFDVIDLDNNGILDEDEFMQVLRQLERRAGIQHKFVGRVGKNSVDMDDRQMTHQLFEHQGGKGVSLKRFKTFLRRLQDGMLKLEFAHYDMQGKGTIKGCDFANSLVTAADIRIVDAYLDKVQQLPPQLAQASITFKQFQDYAQLRRNVHMLAFALDFCTQIERPLSKDDFEKLLQKSLGVKLAPAVLDIVFAIFGDSDGMLNGPAFAQLMKSRNRVPGYRKGQGLGVDGVSDTSSALMGWFNCVRNCSFAPSGHDSLAPLPHHS